ncbi:hypothetical protein Misp01_50900 [Microtetraspora sp. NBRC 13810]|uniref:hypothetical protein n=1 Tax=Microtetraspora sp. NBRC 13810 TaxID=3030990 RepID=UPI0024A188C0|nr:hypothetical protein [Microtetraspora sp. NBRC 13810]GLW09961.1 hypothetical protein Misp01_50900 [Microtetraspora sp. NBRC 13810]
MGDVMVDTGYRVLGLDRLPDLPDVDPTASSWEKSAAVHSRIATDGGAYQRYADADRGEASDVARANVMGQGGALAQAADLAGRANIAGGVLRVAGGLHDWASSKLTWAAGVGGAAVMLALQPGVRAFVLHRLGKLVTWVVKALRTGMGKIGEMFGALTRRGAAKPDRPALASRVQAARTSLLHAESALNASQRTLLRNKAEWQPIAGQMRTMMEEIAKRGRARYTGGGITGIQRYDYFENYAGGLRNNRLLTPQERGALYPAEKRLTQLWHRLHDPRYEADIEKAVAHVEDARDVALKDAEIRRQFENLRVQVNAHDKDMAALKARVDAAYRDMRGGSVVTDWHPAYLDPL